MNPLRHDSMYDMPPLYTFMDLNSTPDVGLPSYRDGEKNGLNSIANNGAHQQSPAPCLVASAQLESGQIKDWVSHLLLEELMSVTVAIDTKLRELQDLYRKHQDALARLGANISLNATTTPCVPISTTSHYPTTNISPHSFIQGETGNIPPHMQTSSTSSITPYAQLATYPPPEYPVRMDETSQMILHHETLGHAKKPYTCRCGKGYSRKDSLLRHAAIHTSERIRTSEVAFSES